MNSLIDVPSSRAATVMISSPEGERTPNEFAFQVAASRDLKGPKEAGKLTLEVV
jgi:hypothetical protein